MASPITSEDTQVWQSLKSAIARSSGFKRWQHERSTELQRQQTSLDAQIRRYLLETLKTLAY